MSGTSPLALYRSILRYAAKLKYTDKDYFVQKVRKEFKDSKDLTDESQIQLQIEKAKAVLQRKKLV